MSDPRRSSEAQSVAGWKRAAAEAAVADVAAGMTVGLGTGSTAAFAIEALGRRVRQGLDCRAVATSNRTADLASKAGIALLPLEDIAEIDLGIDGVDEIDPELRAIKGAGGAMLREKIVASASRRMIAIADRSKAVRRLGAHALPVEALPLARAYVEHRLVKLRCDPVLRRADGRAVLPDQGNLIFDCHFADLGDLDALDAHLSAIPGLLGHGLFLTQIDALYLGGPDGVIRTQRHPQAD